MHAKLVRPAIEKLELGDDVAGDITVTLTLQDRGVFRGMVDYVSQGLASGDLYMCDEHGYALEALVNKIERAVDPERFDAAQKEPENETQA